ncbi:MAG: thiamine diphosphokinase [Treponema sp.]|nr:thiamine diphosphokinase [Treponema sp.]
MLGIVFTGSEGPPPDVVRRLFAEPAKRPLAVAADSGLAAAEAAGLRPDWITGDMDSLDSEARLAAYPADRVFRYGVDKDYTDTELAVSLLREKGCDEVWLLGGGGGRLDHLFAIRSLFERERPPSRWITGAEDIHCLEPRPSGDARSDVAEDLTLTLEREALLSVFPLGSGPWAATSRGLKWPLDGLRWNRGFFGVSNVAIHGEFLIRAEQGRFMVIIPGLGFL